MEKDDSEEETAIFKALKNREVIVKDQHYDEVIA